MGYYKYAKSIFTDSFYGTIFSIIFKKPFITLKNEKIGGEKFISLLKPKGLIHRLLKQKIEVLIIPICLIDVNKIFLLKDLKKIKEKSFLWLENAFKFS